MSLDWILDSDIHLLENPYLENKHLSQKQFKPPEPNDDLIHPEYKKLLNVNIIDNDPLKSICNHILKIHNLNQGIRKPQHNNQQKTTIEITPFYNNNTFKHKNKNNTKIDINVITFAFFIFAYQYHIGKIKNDIFYLIICNLKGYISFKLSSSYKNQKILDPNEIKKYADKYLKSEQIPYFLDNTYYSYFNIINQEIIEYKKTFEQFLIYNIQIQIESFKIIYELHKSEEYNDIITKLKNKYIKLSQKGATSKLIMSYVFIYSLFYLYLEKYLPDGYDYYSTIIILSEIDKKFIDHQNSKDLIFEQNIKSIKSLMLFTHVFKKIVGKNNGAKKYFLNNIYITSNDFQNRKLQYLKKYSFAEFFKKVNVVSVLYLILEYEIKSIFTTTKFNPYDIKILFDLFLNWVTNIYYRYSFLFISPTSVIDECFQKLMTKLNALGNQSFLFSEGHVYYNEPLIYNKYYITNLLILLLYNTKVTDTNINDPEYKKFISDIYNILKYYTLNDIYDNYKLSYYLSEYINKKYENPLFYTGK